MSIKMHEEHGTASSLVIGFVLSVLLTLSSYFVVVERLVPAAFVVAVVLFLALIQLIIQMIFFLHLDKEAGPRWNLAVFISTVSIILLIVGASIWIMHNMNYNMMPHQNVDSFILQDEGIKR